MEIEGVATKIGRFALVTLPPSQLTLWLLGFTTVSHVDAAFASLGSQQQLDQISAAHAKI